MAALVCKCGHLLDPTHAPAFGECRGWVKDPAGTIPDGQGNLGRWCECKGFEFAPAPAPAVCRWCGAEMRGDRAQRATGCCSAVCFARDGFEPLD